MYTLPQHDVTCNLGKGHIHHRACARVCTASLRVINNSAIQLGDLPRDYLH